LAQVWLKFDSSLAPPFPKVDGKGGYGGFFKGGIYMTSKNNFSLKKFNLKNLFSENTKTEIIGLLAILICLWLVFYFIPEIFASLFHTILGKCILFLVIVLVSFYNVKYGIFLVIIVIILSRFSLLTKEGFEWNDKSTKDFILIQSTTNPNLVFDTNMIQKNQASQEEVDYFNKNGKWPWSSSTKELYINAINSNPYVKISPDGALLQAQKIYNETSILMVLSYQTKEGQFLLNGVQVPNYGGNPEEELPNGFGDFPYKSGLKTDLRDDVVRCNIETGNLERIRYSGKDGIYGIQNYSVEPVDYTKLENIIPGFMFTKCPCNPCVAMKMNPEYTCPFKLNVKDRPSLISSVWQKLWNVKNDCTNNL